MSASTHACTLFTIKRKVLTLFEETDIIASFEKGVKVTSLGKSLPLPNPQFVLFKKTKINKLNITTKCFGRIKNKTLKGEEMPKVEVKLYE